MKPKQKRAAPQSCATASRSSRTCIGPLEWVEGSHQKSGSAASAGRPSNWNFRREHPEAPNISTAPHGSARILLKSKKFVNASLRSRIFASTERPDDKESRLRCGGCISGEESRPELFVDGRKSLLRGIFNNTLAL
jgi:hypothetical protein